ncbi:Cytochrome P450 [Mycena venus]|uniref:Cytochrome P450 n=1 Tax=Mycena venus TaxID=2733690 RepID=A0A8H6X2S3_9AGAR|nr:Cytochrome P450 [Mycena venus]
MKFSSPISEQGALGFVVVLCILLLRLSGTKRRAKLPPGPPGIIFFGNLFQLSPRIWLKFTSWKTYGSVVYLGVAGRSIIILNNAKAAVDLLDRRASLYSDRPQNIVASELMGGSLLFAFIHYGDTWRRMRRAAEEGLRKTIAHRFHAIQLREAIFLTHSLLVNPGSWDSHLRRTAASVILSMVYDTPAVLSEEDPKITRINDFVERIVRAAYPGAYLVEYFTWMRYLPTWSAKWKRDALEQHRIHDAMFQGLFNEVRDRIAQDDQSSSFCADLLEKKDRHGLNERESAWAAGMLYIGGAETTSGALAWFIFAMLSFPEVQRRAQKELDAIIGRSRMPTFADYDSLPYMRALIKEVLRWAPIAPLGVPHRLAEDDYYDGHLIPQGSIVITNMWAINRDPQVYGDNADMFEPNRHLDEDSQLGHHAFGFGRRICVGRHVANDSLFIDCANILWALSIEPFRDDNGVPIIPGLDESIDAGIVVRPPMFRCSFTPRFASATEIVANTKELVV